MIDFCEERAISQHAFECLKHDIKVRKINIDVIHTYTVHAPLFEKKMLYLTVT